jgi:uncharacterized protein YcaQ
MRSSVLSLSEARRITLAAQGFDERHPGQITRRHLTSVLKKIGMVQIDSVNVLKRAHYVPLFSRLGIYDSLLLDEIAYSRKHRRLFEYWGHAASLLPIETQPFLRWRMERARTGEGVWRSVSAIARRRPDLINRILEVVKEYGPIGAGDVEKHLEESRPKGKREWWGWTDCKRAMEWLFWAGSITTATRRHFERHYDLTERVMPSEILSVPTPSVPDALRELVRVAARALGVATETDLRDYFRLHVLGARNGILELAEAGELIPVSVENWKGYLHRDAKVPRKINCSALVSPFDPLVWEQKRRERLFGFRYRIEIYTPVEKRKHGYYVLPFLYGDRIVARVDLKGNRQLSCLEVLAAHTEPGVNAESFLPALAEELRLMAKWVGLAKVRVSNRGKLAGALRRVIAGERIS